MTPPARRSPRRPSKDAIAYLIVVAGTVVMAVSVAVTGSADGLTVLVQLLTALALFDEVWRRRRKD